MKILITTDAYLPMINGVVTSIQHLTKHLTKMGHEVKILALSQNLHSYIEGNVTYIASMNADLVYPDGRFTLPLCNELVEQLIKWHPDIVHSQSEFSSYFLARRIVNKLDIPIVHTYHTAYEDYTHYFSPSEKLGKAIVAKASRWLCRHMQAVIAPTEKVRKMLEAYGIDSADDTEEKKIHVVPTGIEAQPFEDRTQREAIRAKYGVSEDVCLLFAIGRLGKEKNFEELLTYLSRYSDPNVRLMLVGDGPDREALQRKAAELSIADRVIFTGMVPHKEVAAYYTAADLFVCASSSETQGLTYLEAQAAGLPIVCRRDDCLADVVIDGENGWQYEQYEEFADYIGRLTDRALREQMGKAAHDYMVKNASAEAFARKVYAIYEQAVRVSSGEVVNKA